MHQLSSSLSAQTLATTLHRYYDPLKRQMQMATLISGYQTTQSAKHNLFPIHQYHKNKHLYNLSCESY